MILIRERKDREIFFFSHGEAFRCYIQSDTAKFLGFFLPGMIVVFANVVLFFFVATEIHSTLSKAPETEQREKTKVRFFLRAMHFSYNQ